MSTRDTSLQELGVALPRKDLTPVVDKAFHYIAYGPATTQPLERVADANGQKPCAVAEEKDHETQLAFDFKDRFRRTKWFYFKTDEMRKLAAELNR